MRCYFLLLPAALSAVAGASTVNFDPQGKGPVTIHRGDVLVVKLDTVSDGGYEWTFSTSKPLGVLNLTFHGVAPKNKRKPGSPPMVGGATVTTFNFKAAKNGRETLSLIYGRPWILAKGGKPEKTLNVAVVVK